jgi:hypothetical protein
MDYWGPNWRKRNNMSERRQDSDGVPSRSSTPLQGSAVGDRGKRVIVLPHLHEVPAVKRWADVEEVVIGRNASCILSQQAKVAEGGGHASFDWTSQRMIT